MIRALAVILGLALGLGGAAVVGGRVSHLRGLGLDPVWSQGLDDAAGILAGQGVLGEGLLRWRWSGVNGWAVSWSGSDWQVQGRATPMLDGLRIDALSGVVPLAALTGDAGALMIEAGALALDLDGALIAGRIEGRATGPVALIWQDGGWVAQAR